MPTYEIELSATMRIEADDEDIACDIAVERVTEFDLEVVDVIEVE